ncbi:ATP-dependent protease La [Dendrothele bispora CBS 962.96]|uniref:Lon protease homolog, mitochondrial n=1 Tax=Dendrothele bispora (strain CBS 962.96) TaxID=1314807 RepID=A0A4S8M213_DENBC|nr:ATP-dependent protease La [Dendrothele bispora CBS 962.96]
MNRRTLSSSATTLTNLSSSSSTTCTRRRTLLSSLSSLSASLSSPAPTITSFALASRRYRTQCSSLSAQRHPLHPRTFSQSFSAEARTSAVLGYPRWINSRTRASDGNDKGSGEGEENNKGASSGEGEDESPPSSSSSSGSSSSPPSSSSSSTPPSSGSSGSSSGSSGSNNNTIAKPSVPEVYPQVLALPIARRPLFPGFYKAVVIRNPHVVAAIKEMMKRGQPYIGAFLLKDDKEDADVITDLNKVYDVGVFAQITSVFSANTSTGSTSSGDAAATGAAPDKEKEEGLTAVLYPHRRIKITELVKAGGVFDPSEVKVEDVDSEASLPTPPSSPTLEHAEKSESLESQEPAEVVPHAPGPIQTSFLHSYPVSIVNVVNLQSIPAPKDQQQSQHVRAFMSEIISVFKDIAQLNPLFRDQITNFSINQVASNVFDEPDKLADFAAAVSSSSGETHELQDVLEALSIPDRLRKSLLVLKKELINAQLQNKLSRDVDSKIAKKQKEYYLMEQLKGIKKELGLDGDGGREKLIQRFRERVDGNPEEGIPGLKMPDQVRKVFEEELNKLAALEPSQSEANVTRNYLEWLSTLPWGVHSPENFSITHARTVLDEDHYGLEDVKSRILEFMAVGKLRGTVEGKIILLVGPPGVGKTSVGKSVARALKREFFRFSVGGLTDVAEIKGHRRTYVGALPGKPIQALRRVGVSNPLILIDEIDKIGRGHNGDPSSALLEMLDPEQNDSFLDHYMDVPINLSHILFVCTANNLSTIPAPLLDRMEVLEVSGYVSEEKAEIARRFLGPQAKRSAGLGGADVAAVEDGEGKGSKGSSGEAKETKGLDTTQTAVATTGAPATGDAGADVVLTNEAIDVLIKYYCRESGVRNLKKSIDKIYRKAALKIVQDLGEEVFPEPDEPKKDDENAATRVENDSTTPGSNDPSTVTSSTASSSSPSSVQDSESSSTKKKTVTTITRKPMRIPSSVHIKITPENLKDYVGPPIYQKDRMYAKEPPAGVSTGLGYLGNGSGAVMPVEAMSMPGKGSLTLTGKLGEVIRESAQISLSYVKAHAYELGITKSPTEGFLEGKDIHVHMPEGSVGKEGPSAGTAILTAFVSLFTGRRVNGDIAMTGEISLVGQVLPVGGLKEKILAAHRAQIKTIIAPAANKADIEENVPESVKEGIKFVYVEDVKEVLEEVFGEGVLRKEETEN